MSDWPHQLTGVQGVLEAIAQGHRRVLLTSPTGGGKTRMAELLLRAWLERDASVALFTNRRLLVEQLSRVLGEAGIDHGVRASGHEARTSARVQLCMAQTEDARVFKRRSWQAFPADLSIFDEAHLQTGRVARKIMERQIQEGGAYVGITATPVGLSDLYDVLVEAGTPSELRACGALVRAVHYGPTEPDLRHIGRVALGEDLTEKQNVKAVMVPGIFGHVLRDWRRLNPEQKPTILFGPGVGESLWFAEQFWKEGISAAHIDGENVWFNGKMYPSSREARAEVLERSKDGRVRVLCNRFVLREGIDAPWLAHGILATVFGSLQSYLQSGGRLLRAHPGLASVTVQDHGGAWWRHGSLNADRHWSLDDTPASLAAARREVILAGREREPACCPSCRAILMGLRCPLCGFQLKAGKKSRPVIQADGKLREMRGDIFVPRKVDERPEAQKKWEKVFYRARNSGMTFRQAEALYARENEWGYPPHTLPLMPLDEHDWGRRVADVSPDRLRAK